MRRKNIFKHKLRFDGKTQDQFKGHFEKKDGQEEGGEIEDEGQWVGDDQTIEEAYHKL